VFECSNLRSQRQSGKLKVEELDNKQPVGRRENMLRVFRVLIKMIGALLLIPAAGLAMFWLFGERWRPLRRSTLELFRSAGWARWRQVVHAYVYIRWSNQYIGYGLRRFHPRPRRFQSNTSDRYHGKVLTHELARQFVLLDHDVTLPDREQVIPYPVARDIVIRHPQAIAIYDCPCRANRRDPCTPVDVCMIIGQPWVDFIVAHNPQSARQVGRAEALAILEAEHERGHVHTAYFRDAMEGRFYAICNCCKCCCGGIEMMMKNGTPMIASSGYVAHIDAEGCLACGDCQEACPFDAISVNGHAVVDTGLCMGCGVCQIICSQELPRLVRDERKALPLDLRVLEGTGDVQTFKR
jgi:ferredoxin